MSTRLVQQLLNGRTYVLNDFDDEHSVSEVTDMSMMSGSYRRHDMSYTGANRLEPSSKIMAGMAAHTRSKDLIARVGSAYTHMGD